MRIVALLAALAVGVGIGYVWGAGRPAPGRAAPNEPDSVAPPAASLTEVLAAIPADTPKPGVGKIRGRVTTTDGRPLPGVLLATHAAEGPPPREYEDTLEDAAIASVRWFKWKSAARHEATSDATGTYELSGLPELKFTIKASRKGYRFVAKPNSQVSPGATVDFVAHRAFELRVDLLLPDGEKPDRAVIHCNDKRHWWNHSNPVLLLDEGDYGVHATVGEDFQSESVRVTAEAGPLQRIVLHLRRRPGVGGKVLVPAGYAPRNIEVTAQRISGDSLPPQEHRKLRRGLRARADRKKNYAYVFRGLPPGRYAISASLIRKSSGVTETVDITDAFVARDLVLEPPDPKTGRVMRVLGPDGRPLDSVRFSGRYTSDRGGSAHGLFEVRRADGSYFVRGPSIPFGGSGGVHTLTVRSREHGEIRLEYEPVAAEELVVRFAEPASLEVTLAGYAGSEHVGQIRLVAKAAGAKDAQLSAGSDQLDREGRQVLGPLPAGDTEILVGVDATPLFWTVDRHPITLEPGENSISIPMPALYPLRILGTGGERFRISPEGPHKAVYIRYERIGADGTLLVPRLGAGTYELSGNKDGKAWSVRVTLPGQAEVRVP